MEALALSTTPLTAYRVAKMYHMNVAKVYVEMKRLAELGLVEPVGRKRGAGYRLADKDLRRLAVKLSSRVMTFDSWRSAESRKGRFRMGFVPVPTVALGGKGGGAEAKSSRMPGELENLAVLGRRKFDSKYRPTGVREYGRL